MASIGIKGEVYNIRFRYQGSEFKKSLKTRDIAAAKAALHIVEVAIHRLLTGQVVVPPGVEAGDFILSGGTLTEPEEPRIKAVPKPSTAQLTVDYLNSQKQLQAPSYHSSQALHIRHLLKFIGQKADQPCDRVCFRDLDRYLLSRLETRHPNTAERERITLMQLYRWAARQGHVESSPAALLTRIKGGTERPPFRTIQEIERLLSRGGLTEAEEMGLWECLYISPSEIAQLLCVVRTNAKVDYSYLLHAIPAYTGMRRGEVLRLRWEDIDLVDGFVYARSRKQSRRISETVRRIDLHPDLRAELTSWQTRQSRGRLVIGEPDATEPISPDRANRCFWSPMRGTPWCLDNGKDWFKVTFHTYRHSFASNLAAVGIDQRIIDEFMGHTTEAMRKRYRHLFPQHRRTAIESLKFGVEKTNG
ncbi:MAG: site-specific integrase [Gemmataceae bacterium]|nr:site-specific integrase [Gemmataceae bacterium]